MGLNICKYTGNTIICIICIICIRYVYVYIVCSIYRYRSVSSWAGGSRRWSHCISPCAAWNMDKPEARVRQGKHTYKCTPSWPTPPPNTHTHTHTHLTPPLLVIHASQVGQNEPDVLAVTLPDAVVGAPAETTDSFRKAEQASQKRC